MKAPNDISNRRAKIPDRTHVHSHPRPVYYSSAMRLEHRSKFLVAFKRLWRSVPLTQKALPTCKGRSPIPNKQHVRDVQQLLSYQYWVLDARYCSHRAKAAIGYSDGSIHLNRAPIQAQVRSGPGIKSPVVFEDNNGCDCSTNRVARAVSFHWWRDTNRIRSQDNQGGLQCSRTPILSPRIRWRPQMYNSLSGPHNVAFVSLAN